MGIKHLLTSLSADDSPGKIQPSNWNADHTIDGDVDLNGFGLLFDFDKEIDWGAGEVTLTAGTQSIGTTTGLIVNIGDSGGIDLVSTSVSEGPFIDLISGANATFEFLGNIGFRGANDAAALITYSGIDVWILDPSAGNELAGFAQYGAPGAAYSFTIADGVVIGDGVFGSLAPGPGIGSISVEHNVLVSGLIQIAEQATPSTPAAGVVYLYAKADHKMYSIGSDAVERALS